MAGNARTTPMTATVPGRSPRRIPTATGTSALSTAVSGATTDIGPIASPRYSSTTPRRPTAPAAAPHSMSTARNAEPGSNPTASRASIRLSALLANTTAVAGTRRAASPPLKSLTP